MNKILNLAIEPEPYLQALAVSTGGTIIQRIKSDTHNLRI